MYTYVKKKKVDKHVTQCSTIASTNSRFYRSIIGRRSRSRGALRNFSTARRETGRWRAQRVRPSSDGLDAAVTQLRYQWSRKLHGLKGDRGQEIRSPSVDARARACVRVCAPTRAAGCMPAGVIDIGKYAMADRSQRAGTNDCSAAHTAALRIHSRASSSAIRLQPRSERKTSRGEKISVPA